MTEVVEREAERCVLWQARLQLHAWQHDPCRAHGEEVREDCEAFHKSVQVQVQEHLMRIPSVLSAHSLPPQLATGAHLIGFRLFVCG